jgi:hypothetical protein
MIRTDGTFTIYRIQHRTPGGRWTFSNFDHFGHPPGFTASEPCWQQTGVMGTFDREVAVKALRWIQNPKRVVRRVEHWEEIEYRFGISHEFRLVVVEITQRTTPLAGTARTRKRTLSKCKEARA